MYCFYRFCFTSPVYILPKIVGRGVSCNGVEPYIDQSAYRLGEAVFVDE
jgi:hypothetical protein